MGIAKGGGARKIADIFDHAGTVAPAGAIALPTAQTNVSRSAYVKLFLAIGTTWGAGDGVTTFGLPWCAPDQATVQASGNVGTQTAGANISHTHSATQAAHSHYTSRGVFLGNGGQAGDFSGPASSDYVDYPYGGSAQPAITVNANGGAANLPAGARVLKCIQYA